MNNIRSQHESVATARAVNVTREHVWDAPRVQCPVAPVRTWQENKAVAIAKVLGSSPVVDARPAIVKAATVPDGRYALTIAMVW